MRHKLSPIQVPHGLAVIRELIQQHVVVRELHSGRDAELRRCTPFVLRERLNRLGVEMFVKVRQGSVDPGARIRWNLIPVGICPFIPDTAAKHAPLRILAYGHDIAELVIPIELVNTTGGRDGSCAVLVVLLVPIAVLINLVIKLPSIPKVGVQSDIGEVRLDVIEVVTGPPFRKRL